MKNGGWWLELVNRSAGQVKIMTAPRKEITMKTILKYKEQNNGDTKFYLKNGELTRYSFACGYIQRAVFVQHPDKEVTHLDLWHEGACYHVRAHDHDQLGRLFWDSYDNLTDARKAFHEAKSLLAKADAPANMYL